MKGLLLALAVPVLGFVPTNEWQVVDPDEPLPPGLEIRLDIQNGVRQARLIQPEEGGSDAIIELGEGGDEDADTATTSSGNSIDIAATSGGNSIRVDSKTGSKSEAAPGLFDSLKSKFALVQEQVHRVAVGTAGPTGSAGAGGALNNSHSGPVPPPSPVQRPDYNARDLLAQGQRPTSQKIASGACKGLGSQEPLLGSLLLGQLDRALDCGIVAPKLTEDVEEWAHDRKFGILIAQSGLAWKLLGASMVSAETSELRQWCVVTVGASLNNNPEALEALLATDLKLFITTVLEGLELATATEANDGNDAPKKKLSKREEVQASKLRDRLAARYIYLLGSGLGYRHTLSALVDANGGESLRQLYQQSPRLRVKLCRLIETHLIPQGDDPNPSRLLIQSSELLAWSALIQDSLANSEQGKKLDQIRLEEFGTLVSIHQELQSLPVSKEFIKWLASKNRDRESDEFRALINASRHSVFGNPNAQRKHDANEL